MGRRAMHWELIARPSTDGRVCATRANPAQCGSGTRYS
jgi:hypothetical protein